MKLLWREVEINNVVNVLKTINKANESHACYHSFYENWRENENMR
jgi:ASC-1-like (ASCH) protein